MMDKAEFTAAVLEAEPALYRVAKAMLRSEQDCADAAQQAILRAWEQLDTLRRPKYFKTWLTRILINECRAILRLRQRLAPYKQEQAECIPAPAADDHSDLYEALLSLDEKYRLPVVLFYLEGFKRARSPDCSVCRRVRSKAGCGQRASCSARIWKERVLHDVPE